MKSFLKLFAFYIVFIALLVICLEQGSKMIIRKNFPEFNQNHNRQLSGYYIHKNTPNYEYTNTYKTADHQENIRTNEQGNITSSQRFNKDDNDYTIFLFGGSAMLGAGQTQGMGYEEKVRHPNGIYAFDISIAGFLESELRRTYPTKNIEVINTASFVRSMHQSFGLYLESVSKFRPDLVISMDGYNGMSVLSQNLNPYKYYEDNYLDKFVYLELMKKIKSKSHLFNLIGLTMVKMNSKKEIDHDDLFDECEEEFIIDTSGLSKLEDKFITKYQSPSKWLQTLDKFQHIVRSDSSDFMFILQPTLRSRVNKSLSANERLLVQHAENKIHHVMSKFCLPEDTIQSDPKVQLLKLKSTDQVKLSELPDDYTDLILMEYFFPKAIYATSFSNSIKSLIESNSGFYINANEAISDLPSSVDFYTDYCHMTVDGNKTMAQIIAQKIIENGMIE